MQGFLLFTFNAFYPRGGMNDFQGSFATLELARTKWADDQYREDYYQIVDAKSGEVVEHNKRR